MATISEREKEKVRMIAARVQRIHGDAAADGYEYVRVDEGEVRMRLSAGQSGLLV